MSQRLPHRFHATLAVVALWLLGGGVAAEAARVSDVRLWSGPEGTRLVLDLSAPVKYEVFALENPDRVVIDLDGAQLALRKGLPPGQGPVQSVRTGPQTGGGLRIVLDLDAPQTITSFAVAPEGDAGHRLVVEMPPAQARAAAPAAVTSGAQVLVASAAAVAREAAPVKSVSATATTGRDVVVAIDAGHGGQDPGAIGRGGTREKDVTLAIARRLAAAIDAEPGMRSVLIRDGDYFVSLRGRIRKAREHGADMFVSVHADSVLDRGVSGSSVYVLSLRGASDEASRWLAERENAADLVGGVSLDDKNDVLASVLLDVTQKEAVSNSVEAAGHSIDAGRDGVHLERDRRAQAARAVAAAAHRGGDPRGRAGLLLRPAAAGQPARGTRRHAAGRDGSGPGARRALSGGRSAILAPAQREAVAP